ncbi:hypothetical protein KUL106_20080 [Alteromonas sp. KUL106]|nr:hypothetical protein KUL106_20080 [Alteromonas sp. KUL106]
MGYKEIKRQVIYCLNKGYVSHEQRNDIDVKNLLAIGQVSLDEVAEIIGRSRGNEYSSSPHYFDDRITVHIIKTRRGGHSWYVKWYFVEPNSVFISVHH